jgi:hypothetical protein
MLSVEPPPHAGRVKGERSDQNIYPGPPGWGLGHEADNLIPVKKYIVRDPWMTASKSCYQGGQGP